MSHPSKTATAQAPAPGRGESPDSIKFTSRTEIKSGSRQSWVHEANSGFDSWVREAVTKLSRGKTLNWRSGNCELRNVRGRDEAAPPGGFRPPSHHLRQQRQKRSAHERA